MNIINFFHLVSDVIFQYFFFHVVSDIIFNTIYRLLYHFNVFGYNSTSIAMLVYFYCHLSSAVIFFSFSFL